ncbi:MAG: M48 family metalloprotease [Acidiferrobacterales bacterium]
MMNVRVLYLISILIITNVLGGCAVNPVSGKTEMALMSEEQEIALGKKNDALVRKRFGVYQNKAMQDYVNRVGQSLVKHSHRPNIKYTFTVLDSPEVNAFALPGGYVYITRGILAYVNSEAEMAAVLGHEIGHVTARHGVRQYSKATATSIGFTIATIFVPELRTNASQQLMNVLGNAMISGYGRDAELQADRLGAQYIARDGYDPEAMIDVIGVLKNQEEFEKERAKREHRKPQVYHGVFASHPSADKRLQQVVSEANRLEANSREKGRVAQLAYLKHINGVVFGDSVSQGIRRKNHFYHLELNMAVDFPEDWQLVNTPTKLVAYSPERDALIDMQLVDNKDKKLPTPRALLEQKLKIDKVAGAPLENVTLPSFSTIQRLRTPWGRRQARVSAVYLGGKAYLIYGAAKSEKRLKQLDSRFLATAASLRALSPGEKQLARGLHIKVVKARKGQTFSSLAKRSPLPDYPEQTLRLINDRYPDGKLQAGEEIKLIQ